MQITKATFYIHETGSEVREVRFSNRGSTQKVPPGLSGLFSHSEGMGWQHDRDITFRADAPATTYRLQLRLHTDGELDAYTDWSSGFAQGELEWEAKKVLATLMPLVVGVDTCDREYIWQRLWYAQRFFYTGRQPLDTIDRMLWDLASRQARQPVYKLLGGARARVPAYANYGGVTLDDMVASAMRVRHNGFVGAKDHSYRGVQGNAELFREVRDAVGDDFILLHDPVESYTCEEAIRIGRELERLNFGWIEEPLQDYDILGLQRLCAALDLPVLALEWIGAIGGQPFNAAPYVALQATDIVRQRGIGITGQLKVAQMAESMGVPVHGGDPHVILAVHNDPLFEAMGLVPLDDSESLDCRGRLVVEDGYMSIVHSDAPVTEPDWDEVERTAALVIV
ncbi:MAG: enolase C-terminal domain-like protein [Candidatus Latescibacterota bacterium]|nr:enolase C-terminal domain-like protein [Candidatus Latescibacterota bacterium]